MLPSKAKAFETPAGRPSFGDQILYITACILLITWFVISWRVIIPASTSPSISIHFLNGPGSHNAARIVERAKSLPRCPIAWQHFLGTNLHHSKATRTAKGSTAIHGVPPLLSGSWFHVDRVSCQLHGESSTFTCHLSTFACSRSSSIIVKPVLKM